MDKCYVIYYRYYDGGKENILDVVSIQNPQKVIDIVTNIFIEWISDDFDEIKNANIKNKSIKHIVKQIKKLFNKEDENKNKYYDEPDYDMKVVYNFLDMIDDLTVDKLNNEDFIEYEISENFKSIIITKVDYHL
jgi:hypothetical protein